MRILPLPGSQPRVIQGFFQGGRPAFGSSPQGSVLQPRARGNAFQIPSSLDLHTPEIGRQPLPATVQQKMEQIFGTSFSDVRVHVGPQAASIGALAFTLGSSIYFAPGQYNPHSAHGQRLLAHELTHVVQQRAGRVRNPFGSGVAVVQDPGLEAEAERMTIRVTAAPSAAPVHGRSPRVAATPRAASVQTFPSRVQPRTAARSQGLPAGPPLRPVAAHVQASMRAVQRKVQVQAPASISRPAGAIQRKITIGSKPLGPEHRRIIENLRAIRRVSGFDVSLSDRAMALLEVMHLDEETYEFGDLAGLVESLQMLSAASPGRNVIGLPQHLPSQVFGTDIPKDKNKKNVLSDALTAGYRVFDTAEIYDSFSDLLAAAQQTQTPLESIAVVHKIKPWNNLEKPFNVKELSQRIRAEISKIPGEMGQLIMLHELDPEMQVNKKCLFEIYKSINSTSPNVDVGLSNVDIRQLRELYEYCRELRVVRIRLIENRFSPYDQDIKVRQFCQQKGIEYVGFGFFGSKSEGICHEGTALPSHHLQVLQDTRLVELAEELEVEPAFLLLAWAHKKGMRNVIYSASHARQNLEAQNLNLTPETVMKIDSFFAASNISQQSVLYSKLPVTSVVKALYETVQDATAWHILDTLMQDRKIALLLENLARAIRQKYSGQGLKDFVYRLMRLVTHLQTCVAKEKTQEFLDWRMRLVDMFGKAAQFAPNDLTVLGNLVQWSQSSYWDVGGAADAEKSFNQLLTGGPKKKTYNLGEFVRFLLTCDEVSDGRSTQKIPANNQELKALAKLLEIGNTITAGNKRYRILKAFTESFEVEEISS